jgi:Rrf2 family protein
MGEVKMRIKTTTNYAIRIVLYLASKQDIATAKEIAQVMNIPVAYELKVTKQLLGAGIIKMYRGVKGGFKLAVAPDEISLFDVINAMDPDLCRNIYPARIEDNYFMHQINLVHSVYDNIQHALNSELRKVSIAKLIKEAI